MRDTTFDQSAAQHAAPQSERILLGRYRVMQANTTGGFGAVLTCWDTRLQRRVAIKQMPLFTGNYPGAASTVHEALAEARTSSMLAHPNIVIMYDFEADDRFAYLVMEYVDGLTLSEFLARVEGGTLTHDECAYMVSCLANALAFAHENGVLHLDIKPTNIIIDRAGNFKLCDFGMATLASAAGYGDARGGTVGYMPPEQILGNMVDERSDVFSLAVVVWQALTGDNPFAAKTADESLKRIERGPRKALSKIDPPLAGMAEEVIMQSLSPDPADRLASMGAFADELIFGLGNPDDGAASIKQLMSQTTDDSAGDDGIWRPDSLPLTFRYPWLAGATERLLSAVVVAGLAYRLYPLLPLGEEPAPLVASLCMIAAAAVWPPLGSVVTIAALSAVFVAANTSAAAILITMALVTVSAFWWVGPGKESRLSTVAALAPSLLGAPISAAPTSVFALKPLFAALNALFGCALAMFFSAGFASNFALATMGADLVAYLSDPVTYLFLLGSAAAAAAGSAIDRWKCTVTSGVMGQVVCFALLAGAVAVAARVENGGIWAGGMASSAGFALLLSVLVSVTTILRGPRSVDEEVE